MPKDEKPKDEKKPDESPSGDEKKRFTTMRLYEDDGSDISDLADAENVTIAEVYRKYCAPIIRKKAIEIAKKKLKRLEDNPLT